MVQKYLEKATPPKEKEKKDADTACGCRGACFYMLLLFLTLKRIGCQPEKSTLHGDLKNKIKMPDKWRTINSLVHKIRLHGRRGKGTTESFSREK